MFDWRAAWRKVAVAKAFREVKPRHRLSRRTCPGEVFALLALALDAALLLDGANREIIEKPSYQTTLNEPSGSIQNERHITTASPLSQGAGSRTQRFVARNETPLLGSN